MSNRAIVVDANILIRAILGTRVREIIRNNVATTDFLVPDVALADARAYLPSLLKKRGIDSEAGMTALHSLESCVSSEL